MLKKANSLAILLVAFGIISPILNIIDINASQDGMKFDLSFVSENDVDDFTYNGEDLDLLVDYDTDGTENDKIIELFVPNQFGIESVPVVDGTMISNVEKVYTNDSTVLYITIPAENDGMNQSFTLDIGLDSSKISSKESYDISGKYYEEGSEDATLESDAKLTMSDYLSNSTLEPEMSVTESSYVDSYTTLSLSFQTKGDVLQDYPYAKFNAEYVTLDLSKMKYEIPGGESGYLSDVMDYVSLDESFGDYTYDNDTHIITFTSDFHLKFQFTLAFDSNFFSEGTIISTNYKESLGYKITEVNGNDVSDIVKLVDNTFSLMDSGNEIDIEVTNTIRDKTILSNYDNSHLFQVEISNYGKNIQDLEFDINIPDGVTVQSSRFRNNHNIDFTIKDSNGDTLGTSWWGVDFDEPIVGPCTITLVVDNMQSGETFNSDAPTTHRIEFEGKVSGDVGEKYTFDYDISSITADVISYNKSIIESDAVFTDRNVGNNTTTLEVVEKAKAPINTSSLNIYEDNTDNGINRIMPGESIDIELSGYIEANDYTATMNDYNSPLIYVNMPSEILPQGGGYDESDFQVYFDNTDVSNDITSVEVVDTNVELPNGNDSTLVVLKMDGAKYETTGAQTSFNVVFNGIVDPEITKTQDIDFNFKTYSFGTLDSESYYDTAANWNREFDEEDTYGLDLSVGDNINSYAGFSECESIEVVVPETVKSVSLVDTTNSGDFYTVNDNTTLEDFSEYYIGTDGTFKFTQQNTTSDDYSNLISYFVLPQDDNVDFILDTENLTNNSNVKVSYTTDDPSDISNVNWEDSIDEKDIATAVRLESTEIDAKTTKSVEIPFTTKYLTIEDSISYDVKTEAITSYEMGDSYITNGSRASITIVKSESPELETNLKDEYNVEDHNDILADVKNYSVNDDYSDVKIDEEATIISTQYYDGTSNELSYSQFNSLSTLKAGDYKIKYVTTKDADAQDVSEKVEFKVLDDASLNVVDYSTTVEDAPKSDEDILKNMLSSARDYNYSDLSDNVVISDNDGYDVDDPKIGNYEITFKVSGYNNTIVEKNSKLTVSRDMAPIDPVTPDVDPISKATISSEDMAVHMDEAPTSKDELMHLLSVDAKDYNDDDLMHMVEYDLGGYNLEHPKVGVYEVSLSVTGENGEEANCMSTLTIMDEDGNIDITEEDNDSSISETGIEYNMTLNLLIVIFVTFIILTKKVVKK